MLMESHHCYMRMIQYLFLFHMMQQPFDTVFYSSLLSVEYA